MNRLGFAQALIMLLMFASGFCFGCAKDNGDDDDQTPAVDDDSSNPVNQNNIITLQSESARVEICPNPFGYQVLDNDGKVIAQTYEYLLNPSIYYYINAKRKPLTGFTGMEKSDNEATLHYLTPDSRAATVAVSFQTDRTIKVTFGIDISQGFIFTEQNMRMFDDEAIYGLTERLVSSYEDSEVHPKEIGSLDRRGGWVDMIVLRSIGVYTPFYQSSRMYGLYVDSTFYGAFDVGQSSPSQWRFAFNTVAGRDPMLTYYIFCGESHDDILDQYTAITGRPFIPPLWAFGHWRWRDEVDFVTGELDGNIINGQVAEDVNIYDQLDFPIGIYMFDRPWTPGIEGFAEFAWDQERFPNPDLMRQSLLDRGYKLIIWGAPWAIGWEEGQNGYEAREYGYYAPHSGNHIDFTNPAAFDWWKNKVTQFTLANDINGWKLDRGDEDQPSTWFDIYWDGRSGAEVRNAYPVIYQKCYHEAMKEARGDDFVNVYRSGYSGSQQYGIANGGDVRGAVGDSPADSIDLGLRSAIIAQMRLAFMGFPVWGSNTGGYQEFRNREVFARWLEFSAFCPLMDIGGTGAHAPWNMPTDPAYDEEMIEIYRTYTTLHHDLAQYIHDYALGSAETGRPISRPLVFDHPDDTAVKDIWDEYYYGPDILVAPVWRTGDRERQVYIPQGDFADYWKPDRTVSGPVTLDESVPLDRIPIFIRKGANLLGRVW